ncbi:MAG TPA: 16S rRNA (uracil(1498)-N(3))-methyltransferase [Anaerolineae bacterium]
MMHRFFITPDQMQDGRVTFSDDQARQIQKVLRLRPGQRVMVLDNAGWAYQIELVQVSRKQTAGSVLARQPAGGEPAVAITLYQSVIKWDRFEWALQKCTEVGVARFVPVITQRSILKAGDEINPNRMARWQRIIAEAAEQSRRGRLPELAPAINLPEAMASHAAQAALIPWEEAEGMGVGMALADKQPQSVALFIGPEGGFTEDEVAQGRRHGIIPVSLGQRILRAETAAVVAAALVLHELGEM